MTLRYIGMKKQLMLVACASVLAAGASVATPATVDQNQRGQRAAQNDLAPYPAAKRGETRHVIRLPALRGEDGRKVEIIVGKTQMIDCNNHVYGGRLQERTAQGWGYNYYVLDSLGNAATTLMGCSNSAKRRAFVTTGEQTLIRYNSKLPIVIYTPNDVEVRYRVWQAGPTRNL